MCRRIQLRLLSAKTQLVATYSLLLNSSVYLAKMLAINAPAWATAERARRGGESVPSLHVGAAL